MKKVKIEVPKDEWGSLNTKYPADSDRVADNEFTAGTYNVDTSVKGVLTKRLGGIDYASLGGAAKDQYEAIFSDGVRHLLTVVGGTLKYSSGDGQVHDVTSGLAATVNNEFATTQDRVYFGNGVQKKVYDRVTSYGGVAYTFPTQTVKNMGAIAPTTAPSVSVAAGGSVPVGVHTYKVTFVYYDSEESNGGLASAGATTTSGNQTVNLTSIPIGGYGVTVRKIYRDNNSDGLYYLVGVILNNTATTFSDTLNAPTTALPDDNSIPPDFTLINLYLDRLFLAGVPGDPYFIFYSEPGLPDIFPSSNYVPCNQEDPITGMVVYLDRLIVFNRRSMGQLLGRTSDQFRYAQIEGSVGCVDNRSIQIRVLNGVPVLIWLSDKGFYAYNGNSVVYISDKIEDQVNFNIQQSVIQKNKITHSDYTIFTQGTKTDGINLESAPGQITTKGPYWDTIAHPGASYEEQTNPKKLWDTQAEWKAGTWRSQLATEDATTLKAVTQYTPAFLSGIASGVQVTSSTIKLATTTAFNGESSGTIGSSFIYPRSPIPPVNGFTKVAVQIIPTRSGKITKVYARLGGYSNGGVMQTSQVFGRLRIETDSGGTPSGTVVGTPSNIGTYNINFTYSISFNTPVQLTAGQKYWIVWYDSVCGGFKQGNKLSGQKTLFKEKTNNFGGETGWQNVDNVDPWIQYDFLYDKYTANGSWESATYDSKCDLFSTLNKFKFQSNKTTNDPTFVVARTFIDILGSNNATFAAPVTVDTFESFSFDHLNFLQNYRYWRIRVRLTTTDDVYTYTVNSVTLNFAENSTQFTYWESEVIDTSSDSIAYSLTTNSSVPSGTTLTTQIATSASPSGPWTYVSFGLHTVRQYAKIKLIFGLSADQNQTATVNSVNLSWNLISTFISKSIDTGTPPSGWDIFQTSFETNSGTVVYSMRSATTEVGLAGATWYTVTNGNFPTSSLPVYQWVQWRAVVTTNPDQIPTIDSVTINWFVGSSTQSIRCASIFYNTNYYLAVAEFESSTNNLLFIFDQEGKWRVYRNLNISTLSYFFNNPYFCDAVTNKIIKFLQGTSDSGAVIPLEFRSKAFDFSADENHDDKVKILEKCIISGRNTGATYTIEYSVDGGDTFYALKDKNGNFSFTTSEDGKGFYKWLRPDFTVNIPSGYSVMLRIYNNDAKEVEIDGFKLYAFVRKHDPID